MSQPGFYFYTGDWLKDTRALSLEARGAWIDLLCVLNEHGGSVTWPLQAFDQYWGTVDREGLIYSANEILNELSALGICTVTDDPNGGITVTSRRMIRENKSKENNRIRQERHRTKRTSNGPVTQKYKASSYSSSYSSSESSSNKSKEPPLTPLKGGGTASPTSLDEKPSEKTKRNIEIERIFALAKEIAGTDKDRARQLCDFVEKTIKASIKFRDSDEVVHAAILETFQMLKVKAEKEGHAIDEGLLWPYLQTTYKYRRTTELMRESDRYKKADIGSFGEILNRIELFKSA